MFQLPTDLASLYVYVGAPAFAAILIHLLSTWPRFMGLNPLAQKLVALAISLVLGGISYLLVQNEPADLPAQLTTFYAVIVVIINSFLSSQTTFVVGQWVGRRVDLSKAHYHAQIAKG